MTVMGFLQQSNHHALFELIETRHITAVDLAFEILGNEDHLEGRRLASLHESSNVFLPDTEAPETSLSQVPR
jgi:hypothetical protein